RNDNAQERHKWGVRLRLGGDYNSGHRLAGGARVHGVDRLTQIREQVVGAARILKRCTPGSIERCAEGSRAGMPWRSLMLQPSDEIAKPKTLKEPDVATGKAREASGASQRSDVEVVAVHNAIEEAAIRVAADAQQEIGAVRRADHGHAIRRQQLANVPQEVA